MKGGVAKKPNKFGNLCVAQRRTFPNMFGKNFCADLEKSQVSDQFGIYFSVWTNSQVVAKAVANLPDSVY